MKNKNLFIGLLFIVLIASFNFADRSNRSGDMSKEFVEKSRKEIAEIINQINLSWVEGRPENLRNYFHKDMMILSPEFKILERE